MVNDALTTDALGVWHELELALAGRNGFGGDVAEIYAYRLVPGGASALAAVVGNPAVTENARLAGKNMTALLRRFAELHEGVVVSIEEREGFRVLDPAEEFPPFDWRVHLQVEAPKTSTVALPMTELRAALRHVAEHSGSLVAMLDELAGYRAKERLDAETRAPVAADDLPPDAATGLYLDRPFDAGDLEWIKMAWDAYQSRSTSGGSARSGQLMLVFQAIRRDDRATQEFLRVMHTIVLPLCRRLRLKEQPHLRNLGAASE